MQHRNAVILQPLVNEKSTLLLQQGLYTFQVSKEATKVQIERVITELFKVDVLAVKTVTIPAKRKSQRSRRGFFLQGGMKKAIVKLKKGQKIAIFEQASAQTEEVEVVSAEGESLGKVTEKKSLLRGTKVRVEKIASEESQESSKKNKKGDSK